MIMMRAMVTTLVTILALLLDVLEKSIRVAHITEVESICIVIIVVQMVVGLAIVAVVFVLKKMLVGEPLKNGPL